MAQGNSTVHDVVIIGSGAGGGTVTKVLADLGIRVLLMEAGPMVSMSDFKTMRGALRPRGIAARARRPSSTRRGQGLPAELQRGVCRQHRRRALHRRAGQPVPAVPIARDRRPHQPLRARPAALLGLRLQEQVDARRRLGLADRLRGHGAVLRQGRAADRRHGPARRAAQRAGRHLPDAGAVQGARSPARQGVREARHQGDQRAAGGHHERAERASGVHLLRAVRPRVPVRIELRVELRADLPRDADRQRDGADQRDGARAHHRRVGQGHRRVVHRQDDRRRAAGAVPHGGAVGGLVRVGAAAAQLEVVAPSQRPGQLVRHRRQVPDRHGRLRAVGHRAVPARHARSQHRRLRRAPLHSVVDGRSAQRARFPARLSRRGRRRRLRHAGARLRRRRRTTRARATACR